ncbi:MAG: trigger factor [Phycisphaerae bacterium]
MTDEQAGLEDEQTAVDDADQASEEPDEAAKLKEAIEVSTEDVGTLRKKLTITIPRDAIDERLDEQYSELKRDSIVPGFRKGHAPLKLIQKRFGHDVGDQLISKLVSAGYLAAIEKAELKPIGDPLIWARGKDQDEGEKLVSIEKALEVMELPDEESLTFACEIELRPEFEFPELEGIKVDKPKVEITDEDVDAEIKRYQSMRGQYVPLTGGTIEEDDLIIADMTMRVDGKVVKEEKNASFAARGQVIEGVVIENLGDALIGTSSGDTVTAEADVGDDHENLDYRGKKAAFEIAIKDVKRLEVPALDQQFIEVLGFDSKEELRSHLRYTLESYLSTVVQRGMRGQIGKYLLENCEMELPTGLSQRQTERVVARRKVELWQRGVPDQEVEKHMDELRSKAGEDTVKELKLFFIMEKVAEQMEIEVLDEELNGAIAGIAARQGKRFDRVRDELSKGEGLMALYLQLRDDKILDALLQKAVITEIEGPKKKTAKKAKKTEKTTKSTVKKSTGTKKAGRATEKKAQG